MLSQIITNEAETTESHFKKITKIGIIIFT